MFSDLAIIIVNWNLKEDTQECIASLIKAKASLSQIIIVDNGSTDGSINTLRNYYQDAIHLIEAKENLGYAAGANLGIRYAMHHDYQWLLLLNNDTTVAQDFIEEMNKAGQKNEGYFIFAPIILYHSQPSTVWSMGDRRIDHTLLTTHLHKGSKVDRNWPEIIPIDFTNGCAMMINRNVVEKIGLLDESLFMYGEEVDYCCRARQAGFKFACYPSARMWHKISKSSNRDRPGRRYLQIKNQIYIYQRYSHGMQKLLYFVYTLLRLPILCLFDLLNSRENLPQPAMRGWLDGWFKYSMIKNG